MLTNSDSGQMRNVLSRTLSVLQKVATKDPAAIFPDEKTISAMLLALAEPNKKGRYFIKKNWNDFAGSLSYAYGTHVCFAHRVIY